MMRIAILGELPPTNPGGVGVHISNLSRYISNHAEITIISTGKKNEVKKKNGIHIYFRKIPFEKRYTTLQRDFVKISFLNKLKARYDLIHYHGLFSPFGFLLNDKIPLVITAHGYSSFETVAHGRIKPNSIQFKFMRWMEKKTVERADAVIAVGETLRRWIIEELGAEPEKVFYVPNGIAPEIFKPIPPGEISLNNKINGDPILIFTKHFSPIYGAKDLILAFKEILMLYPNAKLIMLGDNRYKNEVVSFSKEINVYNNIYFVGRVENKKVPYYLSLADIFINPTRTQETFGISLIEAMACEVPVIATAVGGPKEILDEGKRQMGKDVGILIPPKNPKAIADAIIYLLEHPEEAREMGKRAREFVLKNYTWDIVAKKTLDVYKYAIENHQR